MFGFKKFISESLDSSYPLNTNGINKVELPVGTYSHQTFRFNDHKKNKHVIHFAHNSNNNEEASVSFHPENDSSYDATGDQGHHALKMFSTAKKAMEQYSSDNPHVKILKFTSDKEVDHTGPNPVARESSRTKLYRNFTRKAGGSTEEGEFSLTHKIPTETFRK